MAKNIKKDMKTENKAPEPKDDSLEDILNEVENLKKSEQLEKEDQKNIKKQEEGGLEGLEEEVQKLKDEKKNAEEKFLRVAADMQNIRRRSDEEKIKARQTGAADVLKPILTVVDTFARAFDNVLLNS